MKKGYRKCQIGQTLIRADRGRGEGKRSKKGKKNRGEKVGWITVGDPNLDLTQTWKERFRTERERERAAERGSRFTFVLFVN